MIACDVCEQPTAEVWMRGGRNYCPACWGQRTLSVAFRDDRISERDAERLFAKAEQMRRPDPTTEAFAVSFPWWTLAVGLAGVAGMLILLLS